MNFEKYEVDIELPKYPKKPFISKNPTAEQARKYADDLEIYNKQLAEYRSVRITMKLDMLMRN